MTHAEKLLPYARVAGQDSYLDEGITHFKEAMEHGKAGHGDVGTEHTEVLGQRAHRSIENMPFGLFAYTCRPTPSFDLMIAWVAITLFGTTICLLFPVQRTV